jgi:uncharacterized protein YndB with AHSA1/START domain
MTKIAALRSLVVEREMPHPPDKIWRALTQAPLIEEWLMKNDFQPKKPTMRARTTAGSGSSAARNR